MATGKENKIIVSDTDLLYGCCPVCKQPLVQAKNGMDGVIKCPKCNTYIHIAIEDDTVRVRRKLSIEE